MAEQASCVFLTMPTSGTGSLWRLITTIGGSAYKPVKIAEELENAGRGAEIPDWVPEPTGHIYMYNTPHFVNRSLADAGVRLITNFRDPRDLACNQFHWALQHPIGNKSAEFIENFRARVAEDGIDRFVAKQDNNILFNSLRALAPRLQQDDPNILRLSYSQLCLDFDSLIDRLVTFLDVPRETIPWELLERERTVNLQKNPSWIGQIWTGTDIMPGRYRRELQRDTIAIIDDRYRDNLKLARSFERPHLRHLLATEADRDEMDRVLVGRADQLFLRNDANNTIAQITGRTRMSMLEMTRIGMAHRSRELFGATIANFAYGHCVIPSKEVAHRADLPEDTVFEQHGRRPLQQYADADITALWRPFYEPSLLEPAGAEHYYPRTDSHWNHGGAFRYVAAFLASVSPSVADQLESVATRRFPGRQQGDLGLKLEIGPEPIEIVAPVRPRGRVVFENGVTNEGCIRWYVNDTVIAGRRAFVMHDSFTLWLLGILPELFSEVVFFHGTIFDYEFVRQLAPDIVLCLQAERFFVRAPETGGDMLQFVARQELDKKASLRLADHLGTDARFARHAA